MGLVQRVLEARGLPTVALSMIPELTRAVGVPRLAGISYPMGRPFVWPESPAQARNASRDLPPPPIVELLMKKPWLLANLYTGRIPQEASAA